MESESLYSITIATHLNNSTTITQKELASVEFSCK